MKIKNWKKYTFEFLSIFIAVVSAFALTNWSTNRNNQESEQKILTEIKNGISIDTKDFKNNIRGHNLSIRANRVFRNMIENKPFSQDSIGIFFISLFRDYTPVINRSGYESLKEAGLKTITEDSLRLQIITLYDYHYGIIEVLDNVNEMQSFQNYFTPINKLLHPYMEFDSDGKLIKIKSPTELSEIERKEILSYLWRLENNRSYKLGRYNSIIQVMKTVKNEIELELEK